jgi:hypothetical protein
MTIDEEKARVLFKMAKGHSELGVGYKDADFELFKKDLDTDSKFQEDFRDDLVAAKLLSESIDIDTFRKGLKVGQVAPVVSQAPPQQQARPVGVLAPPSLTERTAQQAVQPMPEQPVFQPFVQFKNEAELQQSAKSPVFKDFGAASAVMADREQMDESNPLTWRQDQQTGKFGVFEKNDFDSERPLATFDTKQQADAAIRTRNADNEGLIMPFKDAEADFAKMSPEQQAQAIAGSTGSKPNQDPIKQTGKLPVVPVGLIGLGTKAVNYGIDIWNSMKRGWTQGKAINQVEQGDLADAANGNPEALKKIDWNALAKTNREISEFGQTEGDKSMERAFSGDSVGINDFVDFFTALPGVTVESLANLARSGWDEATAGAVEGAALGSAVPGIGTVAGAGVGVTAGMIAAGRSMEYYMSLLEELKNKGVDVNNPEALKKGMATYGKGASEVATTRANAITAVETLLPVLGKVLRLGGGKIAARAAGKLGKAGKVAEKVGGMLENEAIAGPLGGSGGELAAQVSSGQDINLKEIAAEAGGEGAATAAAVARAIKGRATAPTPPTQLGGIPTIPAPPNAPEFQPPVAPVPPPSGAEQTTYVTVSPEELQAFRVDPNFATNNPERAAAIADDVALIQSGQMDINAIDDANYRVMVESALGAGPTQDTGVDGGNPIESIEKRMAEIEGNPEFKEEFNRLEKEAEKLERNTVFEVPLENVESSVDALLQKEKDKPNGFGSFIERQDASDTKLVAKKYLNPDSVSDDDAMLDFKEALLGNPDSWYADGLKLRESANLLAQRGVDINIMLDNVAQEFTASGQSLEDAKKAIAIRLSAILPAENVAANEGQPLADQAQQNLAPEANQPVEAGAAPVATGESGRPVVEGEDVSAEVVEEEGVNGHLVNMPSFEKSGKTETAEIPTGRDKPISSNTSPKDYDILRMDISKDGKRALFYVDPNLKRGFNDLATSVGKLSSVASVRKVGGSEIGFETVEPGVVEKQPDGSWKVIRFAAINATGVVDGMTGKADERWTNQNVKGRYVTSKKPAQVNQSTKKNEGVAIVPVRAEAKKEALETEVGPVKKQKQQEEPEINYTAGKNKPPVFVSGGVVDKTILNKLLNEHSAQRLIYNKENSQGPIQVIRDLNEQLNDPEIAALADLLETQTTFHDQVDVNIKESFDKMDSEKKKKGDADFKDWDQALSAMESVRDAAKALNHAVNYSALYDAYVKKAYEIIRDKYINGTVNQPKQLAPAQTPAQQVATLRAEEQAEYDAMPDPNDAAKREEIYGRYDKLIRDAQGEKKPNIVIEEKEAPKPKEPFIPKQKLDKIKSQVKKGGNVLLRTGKIEGKNTGFFAIPEQGGPFVDDSFNDLGVNEETSAYTMPNDFKVKDLSNMVFDDYKKNKEDEKAKAEGYDGVKIMEMDGTTVMDVVNPKKLIKLDESLPELRNEKLQEASSKTRKGESGQGVKQSSEPTEKKPRKRGRSINVQAALNVLLPNNKEAAVLQTILENPLSEDILQSIFGGPDPQAKSGRKSIKGERSARIGMLKKNGVKSVGKMAEMAASKLAEWDGDPEAMPNDFSDGLEDLVIQTILNYNSKESIAKELLAMANLEQQQFDEQWYQGQENEDLIRESEGIVDALTDEEFVELLGLKDEGVAEFLDNWNEERAESEKSPEQKEAEKIVSEAKQKVSDAEKALKQASNAAGQSLNVPLGEKTPLGLTVQRGNADAQQKIKEAETALELAKSDLAKAESQLDKLKGKKTSQLEIDTKEKAAPTLRDVEFTMRRPEKNEIVFVPIDALLKKHAADQPSFDIQKEGNRIKGRVEKAKEFLKNYLNDQRAINPKTGERMKSKVTFEPSVVDIDENGKISFEDGRHRVLAAKELGITEVPIEVPKGKVKAVESLLSKEEGKPKPESKPKADPFATFDTKGEDARKVREALKQEVGPEMFRQMQLAHKNAEKILRSLPETFKIDCP